MTKVILAKSSNVIGFFVILVLLSLIAFGPYFNFQSIVLFGFIPGLFLIALRNDLETLHIGNREIVIYAILISFTIITIFQDINYESFILAFNGIISGLVASYIPIGLNKNKDYETFFHVGFILSIIALFIIEYSLGNFSLTGFASAKASRGRFFYNANYYSYISYFANFSLFYLHIKYRTLFTSVLLLILPVFFVIMSFITQSRSGLFFILVLNGIFWFLIFKNNKANIYYKIFQKLLLISLAVFSIIKFIDTYQNSQIKGRVAHTADDYRKVLAYEALDVFASHPIIGVGLGQFPEYSRSGLFSHNSYTEILAEQGIIGGILLLLLFVNPTVISFKNLRRNNKDPILRLNFMFFTSFLLYNNAYVFYKVSFAMIYFFLIVSIQNKANIKKMKNQMSLKEKAINGFGWTVFEGILSQGVLFIVGIILARLLTPEDFGIIGIISVFVAIAGSLVEGGFSDALIRKPNVNDIDFNTVFYSNILVSLFIYFLVYIFAFEIAEFFSESSLEKILKYSGLIIIINSFSLIQGTILTINLNFKTISAISIVSSIIGASVALFMAYKGYVVWSLVMLSILRPLVGCILLWIFNSWKPSAVFSTKSFKELFDFGYKILVSQLINTIYKNIYYFLIGKFFSPASLGYYTRANQFQAPFSINITHAISRISYPILSNFQNDKDRLKAVFRKFMKFSVLINFTVIMSIAAIAKPLVLITIGEKWEPSIFYLQLLCIPGMLYPLQILNINLLTALGHSNLMLKLEVIKKIILIPLTLFTAFFSIKIMLYGLVLFSILEYFINSFYAKNLINYSILNQIKDVFPAIVIASITFVVMYIISYLPLSLIPMLLIQLFLGLITFYLANEKFKLNEYLEIKTKLLNFCKLKRNDQ